MRSSGAVSARSIQAIFTLSSVKEREKKVGINIYCRATTLTPYGAVLKRKCDIFWGPSWKINCFLTA